MKRIIFIALILLGVVAPTTYAQISKKKVAVYMTGEIEDSYKKVIGAKLVSAITATDEYAAVERTADFLAALASEQDYQTSGEVRDSQIASIGQRFGVLYVVVADVNELFGEIFISARLINVETGLVEKAADASAAAKSMSQLVELSTQISNKLLLGSAVAVSTTPIHLSLCAIKDGKYFYITKEKWNKMDDATKSSYNKKGICLIDGSKIMILQRTAVGTMGEIYKHNVADYDCTAFIKSIENSVNSTYYDFYGTSIKGKSPNGFIWYGIDSYIKNFDVGDMYVRTYEGYEIIISTLDEGSFDKKFNFYIIQTL